MKLFILLYLIALIVLFVIPAISQDTTDGMVWYPDVVLSDAPRDITYPGVALTGDDTLHIIWANIGSDTSLPRLSYTRSTDGGKTFQQAKDLLPDSLYPDLTHAIYLQHIYSSGPNVYVFFCSSEGLFPFDAPLRMLKSTDGGTTFSRYRNITPYLINQLTDGAICGDTLVLNVQTEIQSQLIRTTNGGVSWSTVNNAVEYYSHIALTPGMLHFAAQIYQDSLQTFEVEYWQSTNLGSSWKSKTMLSTPDDWFSDVPCIAAHQSRWTNEIWVSWRDTKYGWYGDVGASILARTSIDGGRSWLPEENLTGSIPHGTEPLAAVHQNIRAVTWWEEGPQFTFQSSVRASNSSLLGLCPMINVTSPGHGDGIPPTLVVSSHAIHIISLDQESSPSTSKYRCVYHRGEFFRTKGEFNISTGGLVFDTTEVADDRVDSLEVHNTGTDPLDIGQSICIEHPDLFWIDNVTIPPASTGKLPVHFRPLVAGDYSASLLIYHNGKTSPDLFTVKGIAKWHEETVDGWNPGAWNLVSSRLYPGGPPQYDAFAYTGSHYRRDDTLQWGLGYWIKPASPTIKFLGGQFGTGPETLYVHKGWNLIGSAGTPINVNEIQGNPLGLVTSQFFGYNGSQYVVTDSLLPWQGYWVKVQDVGTLIFAGTTTKVNSKSISSVGYITIHPVSDLPPAPPSGTISNEHRSNKVLEFSLEQNYPNPFNPKTELRFSIKEQSRVQLTVYDVYGRLVARIVDENLSPGIYTKIWDGSANASGVYYYRLTAGTFSQTRKMVLVK